MYIDSTEVIIFFFVLFISKVFKYQAFSSKIFHMIFLRGLKISFGRSILETKTNIKVRIEMC